MGFPLSFSVSLIHQAVILAKADYMIKFSVWIFTKNQSQDWTRLGLRNKKISRLIKNGFSKWHRIFVPIFHLPIWNPREIQGQGQICFCLLVDIFSFLVLSVTNNFPTFRVSVSSSQPKTFNLFWKMNIFFHRIHEWKHEAKNDITARENLLKCQNGSFIWVNNKKIYLENFSSFCCSTFVSTIKT